MRFLRSLYGSFRLDKLCRREGIGCRDRAQRIDDETAEVSDDRGILCLPQSHADLAKEGIKMASPEELIAAMTTLELQELLDEMGFIATESQAEGIKNLVEQTGSLDAALETIAASETEVRRAA